MIFIEYMTVLTKAPTFTDYSVSSNARVAFCRYASIWVLFSFHACPFLFSALVQGHAVLSTKMVRNKIIRKPKPKKKKKKSPEASEEEPYESDDEAEEDEEDEHTDGNGEKPAKAVSDGSSSPSNSTTRNGVEQI